MTPRVLVKFLTRRQTDPVLSGALLVYGLEPCEILRMLASIRARFQPKLTPAGYLVNDGTVLAVELARRLPPEPVGMVSLSNGEDAADSVLEVVTDMTQEGALWDYWLDGTPVNEAGRPLLPKVIRFSSAVRAF